MQLSLSLDDEVYERVRQTAEKTGLSKAEVIRKSITNGSFDVLDEASARPVIEAASETITEMKRLSSKIRQLSAGGVSDEEAEKIIACADRIDRQAEGIKDAVRKTVFRKKAWLLQEERQ